MKIGLFTDAYFPTTNGITYVVDILRRNLEELGHEVWIFAPEPRLRQWVKRKEPHVVRFPAIEGLFFDEQLTSFFFPPRELKKITELHLDIIMLFTPAQVGLMGAYAAVTNDIVLVEQYSTDLIMYVKQYPGVLPGILALMVSLPVTMRARPREMLRLTRQITARRDKSLTRTQASVKHMLNMLHDRCDLLIAVSEKSADQLKTYHGRTPVAVVPTGVNAIQTNKKAIQAVRKKWKVTKDDVVCLYVGRLGAEKNVELLIRSFHLLTSQHKEIKLVLVGGMPYAEVLKKLCSDLGIQKQVIFTGRVDRNKLGPIYAAGDIFCFPSQTDTQALVINEAAHAGLPIVWCDKGVNDVAQEGRTGLRSEPTIAAFASAIEELITDKTKRRLYGKNAKAAALKMTERHQTKKLAELLKKYI